ncbi:MAG TPA: hypothetical protein PLF37_05520 [Planctomycetota bacterium]|nr:hypothetical protein [Planctomycetota bacterium]
MRSLRYVAFLCVTACGLILLASQPDAQGANYEVVSREYDRTVDRPSLFKRWRGMLKLADTRDERALATLSKRYERPEDPSEAVAHLIVHICATRFSEAKFAGAFDAWTRRNAQAKDAWLWYQNARIQASAASSDALVADVKNSKLNVFLRAATLEALASRADASLLSLIPAVLNELPAKGAERAVMLESCAAALLSHGAKLGKDEFKPVAERVIRELDDKKNDERSKLVIARLLKILFKTDTVALESGPWLDLLNNIQPKAPTKPSRYTEKKPQFLGIESTGRRVAYVIDLSDSMLIPLTQKEKEDLKKPLTRGPGEKKDPEGNPPKKEEPKDSKFPGEKDLPWDKINNRFEAAREFLKLSLRALDKDMSFVIIGFGHEAEILTGKGIVPASKQNIETAIKILDEIKAGPSDTNRPHGTLKGFTNLHGGMLRAFRAVTGSLVRGEEHIAKETFEQGVDTIFLLSDGAPSWEDFARIDKRDPEDTAGDPETGAPLDTTEELIFHGTYEGEHLTQDIERMNLLRKCEIHCIGLGEANFTLLEQIARIGRGKVRKIGTEK